MACPPRQCRFLLRASGGHLMFHLLGAQHGLQLVVQEPPPDGQSASSGCGWLDNGISPPAAMLASNSENVGATAVFVDLKSMHTTLVYSSTRMKRVVVLLAKRGLQFAASVGAHSIQAPKLGVVCCCENGPTCENFLSSKPYSHRQNQTPQCQGGMLHPYRP